MWLHTQDLGRSPEPLFQAQHGGSELYTHRGSLGRLGRLQPGLAQGMCCPMWLTAQYIQGDTSMSERGSDVTHTALGTWAAWQVLLCSALRGCCSQHRSMDRGPLLSVPHWSALHLSCFTFPAQKDPCWRCCLKGTGLTPPPGQVGAWATFLSPPDDQ